MVSVIVQEPEHTMHLLLNVQPPDSRGIDAYLLRVQYESRQSHPRHIVLIHLGSGKATSALDEFEIRHPLGWTHSFKVEMADVNEAVEWWLANCVSKRAAEDDSRCTVDMYTCKCVQVRHGEEVFMGVLDLAAGGLDVFCSVSNEETGVHGALQYLESKCIKAGARFHKLEKVNDILPIEGDT